MHSEELIDWIALSMLPGCGPILLNRALERFGDPGAIAYRLSPHELAAVRGFSARIGARIVEARKTLRKRAELEWRACRRSGIRLLGCTDPGYPAALRTIADPPVLLYIRGDLPDAAVRVAVVGSRRASAYGRRVATGLASGLASRGIEVVSGGARGIDSCAHLGALEEGGRTVAVLGSGLARPYPAENAALFRRIAEQGAVLTEFGLEQAPRPDNFPRRNRLISALSAAVVVVEASRRSGSLVTAAHALEQGREVLAVPGPVSSDRSVGCHRLIQQGAKLIQNLDDILDELSPMYRGALPPKPDPEREAPELPSDSGGSEDERAVLGLIDEVEALHLEKLAEQAPFGVARLQMALFALELRGVVERLPGRYYLRRPAPKR